MSFEIPQDLAPGSPSSEPSGTDSPFSRWSKPPAPAHLDAASLRSLFENLAERSHPTLSLAVELCSEIFVEFKRKAMEEDGRSEGEAVKIGKMAYSSAVPKLCGADNVRDYIACIAHGMLMGVFSHNEGTKLLYAAQVAYAALPAEKRTKKRAKNGPKRPSETAPKPTETAA